MEQSDLEFWAFLAVAVKRLFLPVAVTWWNEAPSCRLSCSASCTGPAQLI
jgi:hypothetical protein